MTLREEIQGGENAALEFKEANRCAEVYVGEIRAGFVRDKLPFVGR